jgi:hypothetical protein
MNTHLFAGVVVLAGSLSAGAADSDTVVFENDRLRMAFGTRPVPALRELTQKSSGSNVIASAAGPLFVLQLAQTNGASANRCVFMVRSP